MICCCPKCFERTCRCRCPKIEIDYLIYPAIRELNKKGYRTNNCCSGHPTNLSLSTYIKFDYDLSVDLTSEYMQFETYTYKTVHERKNIIRPKKEIAHTYSKKRTDKDALIRLINRDLYRWAKTLPYNKNGKNDCINRNNREVVNNTDSIYPDFYFEVDDYPEINDCSKPWVLICEPSVAHRETIFSFLEQYRNEAIYELILNSCGELRKELYTDYKYDIKTLAEKIGYYCSLKPKIVQFGTEQFIRTDVVQSGENDFYISYAYYDFFENPTKYQEYYEDAFTLAPLPFDVIDLEDDLYDMFGAESLTVWAKFFNKMISFNINICVISSKNVQMVFSNKIDFKVSTDGPISFLFGTKEDKSDGYLSVHVSKKEICIFVNDIFMMRKEL